MIHGDTKSGLYKEKTMEKNGLVVEIKEFSQGDFSMLPISLHIPKGSVMGLIGENGAGKTMLINLITNQMSTGQDSITYNGQEEFRDVMAFIFDENPFGKGYKVKHVGKLMSYAYETWNQALFESYCKKYELNDSDKVSNLSLGMSQRLMQAVALSHSAELFVFDEPGDGIDPFIRSDILSDLRDRIYEDEATVLISSHNVKELESIVDYVTYLEKGQILFSLDIETFRDQATEILENLGANNERYLADPSLDTFVLCVQTRSR